MTNPDSLQAICAELRDVLVVRLERLDAEMRKELDDWRYTFGQGQESPEEASAALYTRIEEIKSENAELRARLAACEKALGNLLTALSDSDEEGLLEHADVICEARAALTPTAHPDVPVNLCTKCGALVPVDESAKHCAGHDAPR